MKRIIAIILAMTLLFSFMAVPASAALNNPSDTTVSTSGIKSIFERIGDFFHNLIANIFKTFGMECPMCENHDGYTDADGDGTYTKNEIITMYNDGVNSLKAYKKPLKITHTSKLGADITDASAVAEKVFDSILEDYTGQNTKNYNFKYNENAKISAVIPPNGKDADLNVSYIDYISYSRTGDYGVIEFGLKDAESRYDGTSTTVPLGYSDVLTPVDLSGSENITEADISYQDTVVKATLDIGGNVKTIEVSSKITISAVAKIGSVRSNINITLDCNDEYSITY